MNFWSWKIKDDDGGEEKGLKIRKMPQNYLKMIVLRHFILLKYSQSVMNVFAPIALITCSALGADPRGCMILISAGALTAYMTPSATAAVAMCMSAGGYDVKALFKMGWLFALIATVVYVLFVSLVYPAF